METLKQTTNRSQIIALFAIGSVGMTTQHFWDASPDIYFIQSFFGSALLAILIGWIGPLWFAAVIHHSARLFGGHANMKTSIEAVAWSLLPAIISLLLFLIVLLCFGETFFTTKLTGTTLGTVKSVLSVIRILLSVAASILLIRGIMRGYALSMRKAMYAVLSPIVLFAVCGLGIYALFTR